MARSKLSLECQLQGIRSALASARTPPQLQEGLRRRAEEIEKQLSTKLPPEDSTKKRNLTLLG